MDKKSKSLIKKIFIKIIFAFFISGLILIFLIEFPNYKNNVKMLNNNYYYFFQSQSTNIEQLFSTYEEKAKFISASQTVKESLNNFYKGKISSKGLIDILKEKNRYYSNYFKDIVSIFYFDKNGKIIFRNDENIPSQFLNLPGYYSYKSFVQNIVKVKNKKFIKVFSPILDNNSKYLGFSLVFYKSSSIDNLLSQNYSINNIALNIELYLITEKDSFLKYSDYQTFNDTKFVQILNKASHRTSNKFYKTGDFLYNFKRINYSNWIIGFKINNKDYFFKTKGNFLLFSLYITVIYIIILILIYIFLKPLSKNVILTFDEMDNKIADLTSKLKNERDKYLTYLDNIGNIFIVQKINGDLIYINKQGEKLLGYKKEELLGKNWFKKVHKKESEALVKELFNKIKLKEIEATKLSVSPLYTKLNQKKIIQWYNSYIEDENGDIIEIFSSGIDITDKIKLFKEIDQNVRQLNFIINSLNLFIWQLKIYNNGNHELTYLSPSFTKVTGISPEIILYSNIDYINFVLPEDRNVIINLRQEVQLYKEYSGEYRFQKANGQIIWLKDFAYPFKKEKDFVLINGFSLDITQEKENYLTHIFDAISELKIGIIMYTNINGKEGLITYANEAVSRITEYNMEEILNKKTVFDFMTEDSKKILATRYRDRLNGKNPISHFKTTIITKFNNKKTLDLMITTHDIGNTKYIIAILIDITEKEKLEQNLFIKQKMEAIGLITSGIAHDLNNILGGMLGYLELIRLELKEPNFIEYIEQIMQGGNRAKKFISNLLGYSRKGKLEKRAIDINEIINSALNLLKPTIKKNIKIKLDLSKDIDSIEGDPGQIEQIIINLCINATQAMLDGGTLLIKTENFFIDEEFSKTHYNIPSGKYIKLMVQDNGIGMDKETLNKIFDPFFTTKTKETGTGLGLATVYGIVKNHNGIITAYSEKGKGSIFNVYLPASNIKKVKTKISKVERSLISGSGTILVIDDEKILQNVFSKMLNKLGFDVLVAENGRKGVEIYKKNKDIIKLILLDLNMPEMSGKTAFKNLKKINPDIKILITTGFALNEEVQELLNMGADGYIKKPFDLYTLSSKLKEIIEE